MNRVPDVMDNASGAEDDADGLRLDPTAMDSFVEPAAVLDSAGRVLVANPQFSAELGLTDEDGGMAADAVREALDAPPANQGRSARPSIFVTGHSGPRIFDLIILPLRPRGRILVMAVDRTVDVSLRNALANSRTRFKELVEVSSDYAWETVADGSFSMVTPKGLAGMPAKDLIGSQPSRLLDPAAPAPAISPFVTPVPVDGVEVWMRHVDGTPLCFEVSAVPLYDDAEEWRGARGVCRDVTQDRKNRAYLAELRERERVFARITSVFRREADPDDALQVASSTTTHGFGASGCQIYATQAAPALVVTRPKFWLAASFGLVGENESVTSVLDRLLGDAAEETRMVRLGLWSVLVARTIYAGRVVGAILLWRGTDRKDWTAGDAKLLAAISGQVAAAIEQRANYHLLFDASRSDPLTGVLNRRGFYDEMQRRLKRLQRETKTAALVYLDLDNFKLVNDVHGHPRGDEALRHLADILRNNTRGTDLVARLGGDEFAVWLDTADEAVAVKRVQVFLAAAKSLEMYSGAPDRPLRLSIGIAIHDPRYREDINEFMSRADMAMYSVKRAGKGNYALATMRGRP
jgi:diguanylate cyclase (GGDEF)-like protein